MVVNASRQVVCRFLPLTSVHGQQRELSLRAAATIGRLANLAPASDASAKVARACSTSPESK